MITIPPRPRPPPLRCSACIAALQEAHFTFLTHYLNVCDTHDLFPTDLSIKGPSPSVNDVLTALSDSSIAPTPTDKDEPLWAQAMASDECEYWIAEAHKELKSLEDLNVFVLVPCSNIPHGHHPLKGKLICKQKHNDTGCLVWYKVCYVVKGFTQRYGIDYDKTTMPTI